MIGLFDSGIGGLTVLKSLASFLPRKKFIYLGDTARLPYGTKSPDTIRRYTQQNIEFLSRKGVETIVSACHSASSSILQFQITGTKPLYNVIEPACTEALRRTKSKKIGLLATQATVDGGQYQKLIPPPYELYAQAAPLLVPLVEAGWTDDFITDQIIERYLEPLLAEQVDVIILGCTHFPLLKDSIARAMGDRVQLVDPGDCLAQQILATRPTEEPTSLEIYLTDSSPHFIKIAEGILPERVLKITQVDL